MKDNLEFAISPEWKDCFSIVFPVNLKVGTIFTKEESRRRYEENILHNSLHKVTKVEPLHDHPNHIVVSSVIVGATLANDIFEKEKSFLGYIYPDKKSKRKLAVLKYFNEDHLKKEECYIVSDERTEVFSVSTNQQPVYYAVDISKLEAVKVPIEEGDGLLGF